MSQQYRKAQWMKKTGGSEVDWVWRRVLRGMGENIKFGHALLDDVFSDTWVPPLPRSRPHKWGGKRHKKRRRDRVRANAMRHMLVTSMWDTLP